MRLQGGKEVARYVIWGQDNGGARNLDMIVVQPGPNAFTGNIVGSVGGQASNALPFTVRPGNIYFVTASGDDAGSGGVTQPWRSIAKAKNTIGPGDIAYVREGVIETGEENYSAVLSFFRSSLVSFHPTAAPPGTTIASTPGSPLPTWAAAPRRLRLPRLTAPGSPIRAPRH